MHDENVYMARFWKVKRQDKKGPILLHLTPPSQPQYTEGIGTYLPYKLIMSSDDIRRVFFRVILKHHLEQNVLRIPRAFVRMHWEGISNPVILTLPNGDEWKISWERRDEDIWLHEKNWKRFTEFLRNEYLLVFKYKGESRFEVSICDQSTFEIDYSRVKCKNDEGTSKKHYERVEVSSDVEISGQSERALKKKKISNEERDSNFETEGVVPSQSHRRQISEECDASQHKVSGRRRHVPKPTCSETKTTHKEKGGNGHSNEIFGPTFNVTMKRTSLQNVVNVPASFSRNYLVGLEGLAIIRLGNGRTWDVMLRVGRNRQEQAILGIGWKKFSQDNRLKIGDKCKFMLIQGEEPHVSFQVIITRGHRRHVPKPKTCSETKITHKEKVRNMHSNEICGPTFNVTMKRTSLTNAMYVPLSFSRIYLVGLEGFAIIKLTNGRTWDVMLRISRNRQEQTILGIGWKKFSQDNRLKIGDRCKFILIQGGEPQVSFQVIITRDLESPNYDEQNKFEFTVRQCNLQGTTPIIPNKFMMRHGRSDKQYVTLQVGEKSYRVKLIYYRDRAHGRFSAGWGAFWKESKLKLGDICMFEAMDMDGENLVLQVSISPRNH
ncbi:hypothetical protein RJT34_07570 [Clitoria ternatea]|uniref:TF-B3 domain-containing protein n=1 Tax=Clitoria ternatea TaxID=43366 RepID=A0AAN9K2R6_CLITE